MIAVIIVLTVLVVLLVVCNLGLWVCCRELIKMTDDVQANMKQAQGATLALLAAIDKATVKKEGGK